MFKFVAEIIGAIIAEYSITYLINTFLMIFLFYLFISTKNDHVWSVKIKKKRKVKEKRRVKLKFKLN